MTLPKAGSGAIVGSFAYNSIKDRWPRILTKVIDQLHQRHDFMVKTHGEQGNIDVKEVIHSISRLRYLIATDKPLEYLETSLEDKQLWNGEIDKLKIELGEGNVTWYKCPWLFSECFVYRLLHEFFLRSSNLKEYDPFRMEKEKGYFDSEVHLIALGTEVLQLVKDNSPGDLNTAVSKHLQICLWGNKADLSLTGGDPHFMAATLFKELDSLRGNILVDHLDLVSDYLSNLNKSGTVVIVMDNAGLELFTDLCLATILVAKGLTPKVIFHGKAFPWYVSDVTEYDFHWTINQTAQQSDSYLKELGQLWQKFVKDGLFEYQTGDFYTYGFPYFEMKRISPQLYDTLSKSKLLIFKGDLNYRKLVGDRHWDPTTAFKETLRGFEPTNLVSLRTLKAETVCGLTSETLEKVKRKFGEDTTWMVNSDYAVVQSFFK
ncbi:unnamed protein product [Bursaphelenchus xylophilus]|uniref:Sugar phosphate phosphatase n=1 Tax=Bursaphelenchus xylophilus TaxID=6326 RepID=A0A1I7RS92_BURXY|nr:unnamed protein product [Bursaphelenchus xylophilus]CAG9123110.1 unnamed protein product [Bursaphelenchus xylophilus]